MRALKARRVAGDLDATDDAVDAEVATLLELKTRAKKAREEEKTEEMEETEEMEATTEASATPEATAASKSPAEESAFVGGKWGPAPSATAAT